MRYFAYGSNMLRERLLERVPGAAFHATASVLGYRLRFHKRSTDQSGKCNIVKTGSDEDVVFGVVFEIPDHQMEALDKAEGVGQGYHHECSIPVRLADHTEIGTLAYVADSSAIDLRTVPISEDPNTDRRTKRKAETALNAYYGKTRA